MRIAYALALVALTSCTEKDKQPIARAPDPARSPTPAPAPAPASASAPAAASAPAPSPSPPGPETAWTDEMNVQHLVADCAWAPPKKPDEDWRDASPLSCKANLYEQSCADDSCYATDQNVCKPKCEKACDGCAEGCTKSCAACKKPCAEGDVQCKRACAEKCASCKQACLTEKDHCATGTCGKQYQACRDKLHADWVAHSCDPACEKYKDCNAACEDQMPMSKCSQGCIKKASGACPTRLVEMCAFNGSGP